MLSEMLSGWYTSWRKLAPFACLLTSGEFDVYVYAAYRDGVELWYIDKRSMTFRVNGKDYMAEVRSALGY